MCHNIKKKGDIMAKRQKHYVRLTEEQQMIADKIVLSGILDSISKETVRSTLKKHN